MSNQGMYRPAEPQKVDIWRKGEPVMKSSGQSSGFDKSGLMQQEGQSASAGMGVSPATEGGAKFQQQVLSESRGSNLGEQMRTESFAPHTTSAGYDPNLGYTPMSSGGGNQASLASTRELQGGVKEDESLWQKAKHALGADTQHTRDTSNKSNYGSNYGTTGTHDRPVGQQDESLWQKTKHALGVDNDKPSTSSSGTSGSSNLGTTSGTTYGHDAAGVPTKTTTTTTVTEGPPGMTQGVGGVSSGGMTSGGGMTQGGMMQGGMTQGGVTQGGMMQGGMTQGGMTQGRDDIIRITPSSMQRGGMGQSGREDTSTLMHGASNMQGGTHHGNGGMHQGHGGMHQGVSNMESTYHGGQAASYQGNMSEQGGQYQGGSYQHHVGHIGGQGSRLEPQSHFASHGTHQGTTSHPGYVSTQNMGSSAAEPPIMGHHGPMMQGHRTETRQHAQQGVHPAEWQKDRSALEMGHGSVAGSTGMMGSMPPADSHGMMPQKDMSGGHPSQTHAHHQLTPQEIDDEVVGRMRQRGYAPLDLIQCPTHYLALFDLPGVFKDQITLCIDRGLLKMTVHRPENAANPHQKHRNNRQQQQESGLNQQPNPQFQGQQQSGGGFGKVTVEDDVDDDFDVGVVKGIERAYERDRQLHQRSQVQPSQMRDSGSMSSGGGATGGQPAEMRKSPNVLPPNGQYLCKERPTGRIDRFIRLPQDIQETFSDAKLENGVLSVTIGRSPHHQRAGGMVGGSSR